MTDINLLVRIAVDLFLAVAVFFAFAGVVGMLRLPDVYSRMQSSTIISVVWFLSLTLAGILFTVFIYAYGAMTAKLLLVGLFAVLTAPVIGHAVSRAAYIAGNRPRIPLQPDMLEADRPWEQGPLPVEVSAVEDPTIVGQPPRKRIREVE